MNEAGTFGMHLKISVFYDMQFNSFEETERRRHGSQDERYARNNLTHGICRFNVKFAVSRSLFITK